MRRISVCPDAFLTLTVHAHDPVIDYFAQLQRVNENNVEEARWERDAIDAGHAFTVLRGNVPGYNLVLYPRLAEGGSLDVVLKVGECEWKETITKSGPTSWSIFIE